MIPIYLTVAFFSHCEKTFQHKTLEQRMSFEFKSGPLSSDELKPWKGIPTKGKKLDLGMIFLDLIRPEPIRLDGGVMK